MNTLHPFDSGLKRTLRGDSWFDPQSIDVIERLHRSMVCLLGRIDTSNEDGPTVDGVERSLKKLGESTFSIGQSLV